MSSQVECPLCGAASKNNGADLDSWCRIISSGSLDNCDDSKGVIALSVESFTCKCKRSIWIAGFGWFVSFEMIKRIKDHIFKSDRDGYMNVHTHMSRLFPEEMAIMEVSLDTSTVRLYCKNDKCKEEGFLTRTKKMAESTVHFCDSCGQPLKW